MPPEGLRLGAGTADRMVAVAATLATPEAPPGGGAPPVIETLLPIPPAPRDIPTLPVLLRLYVDAALPSVLGSTKLLCRPLEGLLRPLVMLSPLSGLPTEKRSRGRNSPPPAGAVVATVLPSDPLPTPPSSPPIMLLKDLGAICESRSADGVAFAGLQRSSRPMSTKPIPPLPEDTAPPLW